MPNQRARVSKAARRTALSVSIASLTIGSVWQWVDSGWARGDELNPPMLNSGGSRLEFRGASKPWLGEGPVPLDQPIRLKPMTPAAADAATGPPADPTTLRLVPADAGTPPATGIAIEPPGLKLRAVLDPSANEGDDPAPTATQPTATQLMPPRLTGTLATEAQSISHGVAEASPKPLSLSDVNQGWVAREAVNRVAPLRDPGGPTPTTDPSARLAAVPAADPAATGSGADVPRGGATRRDPVALSRPLMMTRPAGPKPAPAATATPGGSVDAGQDNWSRRRATDEVTGRHSADEASAGGGAHSDDQRANRDEPISLMMPLNAPDQLSTPDQPSAPDRLSAPGRLDGPDQLSGPDQVDAPDQLSGPGRSSAPARRVEPSRPDSAAAPASPAPRSSAGPEVRSLRVGRDGSLTPSRRLSDRDGAAGDVPRRVDEDNEPAESAAGLRELPRQAIESSAPLASARPAASASAVRSATRPELHPALRSGASGDRDQSGRPDELEEFSLDESSANQNPQSIGTGRESTLPQLDYTGRPAVAIRVNANVARLQEPMRQVLTYFYQRPEEATARSNWGMMHSLMVYGVDTKVIAGRNRHSLVAWIAGNNLCRGQRLLTSGPRGIEASSGVGLQGHPAQFLAVLSFVDVPTDYPLYAGGRQYTVADLIRREAAACRAGEELTFSLIGLSHYLNTDETWRTDRGETWDFQRVIREELSQPIVGAACGGTHRLMGFSHALRNRRADGLPIDGQWARAEKFLEDFVAYTYELQNRDGSMSTQWFEGPQDNGDIDRKIQTTGHIAEWLLSVTPDSQLQDPRLVAAIQFLTTTLRNDPSHDWAIGPKGHALRTLAIYYSRVYGEGPAWRTEAAASRTATQRSRNTRR